ncbi:MAG TPA: pitrilysin family protein [Candidatus Limnocylindria bacterium]|nr:pitrilysin family protein [Candidatus Limnocylindria bacterium]
MTVAPARTRTRGAAAAAAPHRRTVLPSGLRVVTQAMPGARSASVAIFVPVGSRHEDEKRAGLSHLLEHLVFKGTRGYPEPGALSQRVEGVGGSVNASTDREVTVYSAKVTAGHADVALEAVSELALRPLLRRRDLRSEKPIIIDEIRMYVDSPSDHVFTLFDELLFGRHPLGREIAGTIGSVRRARHDAVVEHWRAAYQPSSLVLSVAGAVDHRAVLRVAADWIADGPDLDDGPPPEPPKAAGAPEFAAPGSMRIAYRRLSQGNLCLGMPGVARDHPDRWALDLLGAILGDGMGSRLFLDLRERRSLVYDVSTFSASYADTGTFGVHAGFDPEDARAVVSAIVEQLDRITSEPVSHEELERARAYTRGRLELRMEDSGAVAGWLGSGETLLPRILTVDEVIERLEAVDTDDLLAVAQRYLEPAKARLAVLGPFRSRSPFERALRV